ncbi:MAG: hypothetical protein A3J38_02780 [Gammaproteobacteria bacterium RIFCSPHIGHO2_12_FULL_45_9]|nr:MAG: hypothetical protein A3J38_02780 [Gammaproteobacteria bacterium RIFCSPHIGHO2_12_FULL_45_9]
MKTIYVGNLPYQTKEEEVHSHFRKYGDIESVTLIQDRQTRRMKGFCFVNFASAEAAEAALAENGALFNERQLRVNKAHETGARSGGGERRRFEGGGRRDDNRRGGYSHNSGQHRSERPHQRSSQQDDPVTRADYHHTHE